VVRCYYQKYCSVYRLTAWTRRLSLEFLFDATKPCQVKVYLVAVETIDDETGCSTYALAHPEQEVLSCDFGEGLGQRFSLQELKDAVHEPFFDLTKLPKAEVLYEDARSLRFPLVVVLEVKGGTYFLSKGCMRTLKHLLLTLLLGMDYDF
jgi:hypothetical protein